MLKKIFIGISVVVGLIVIAGYIVLFAPFTVPPEIGRDLSNNFQLADQQFKERVRHEFTLPMAEADLIARLENQGFEVNTEHATASFHRSVFPCDLLWRIYWKADKGKVASISGMYGGICL